MMEGWNDGREAFSNLPIFHYSILPALARAEKFDSRGPEWYKSFIAI